MDKEGLQNIANITQLTYILQTLGMGLTASQLAHELHAAGYRKLLMVDCPKCEGSGIINEGPVDEVGTQPEVDCPDCHGVGKLPERPKVLSGVEVADYFRSHGDEIQAVGARPFGMFRWGNQAQLEADICHYEGKEV